MTRAQATLLRVFCVWTVWVWGTRIWNIWGDDTRELGFKLVHTVLAVVSVAFAVATWIVVRRLRRRPEVAKPPVAGDLDEAAPDLDEAPAGSSTSGSQ